MNPPKKNTEILPNRPKSANNAATRKTATTSASPGSTAVPLESKRPKVTPVTSEKRRGPRSEKARSRRGGCDVPMVFFGGGRFFTSMGVVSPPFFQENAYATA